MTELILFSVSMLICSLILYVLGRLWFADARNRKLHNLFALGMAVFFWMFFNAISMLVQPQFYPFIYIFFLPWDRDKKQTLQKEAILRTTPAQNRKRKTPSKAACTQ